MNALHFSGTQGHDLRSGGQARHNGESRFYSVEHKQHINRATKIAISTIKTKTYFFFFSFLYCCISLNISHGKNTIFFSFATIRYVIRPANTPAINNNTIIQFITKKLFSLIFTLFNFDYAVLLNIDIFSRSS